MAIKLRRRAFMQLLASGVVGAQFDIERLLWIPGQKTIFIPPTVKLYSVKNIIELEMDRIAPYLANIFDSDELFYRLIDGKDMESTSARPIKIPLEQAKREGIW